MYSVPAGNQCVSFKAEAALGWLYDIEWAGQPQRGTRCPEFRGVRPKPIWRFPKSFPRKPRWFSGKESICNAGDGDAGQSLGWEDSMEEEMATHSSILAWETPWTEEPSRLLLMGSQKSQT